jgi:hypothetical protein
MRTVKEGPTRGDDEENTNWEPEAAFWRIRDSLAIEYSEHATEDVSGMIAEFREIIEVLGSKEIVDKEKVLAMLYRFTSKMSLMDKLSDFLMLEIERSKSNETMRE